MVSPHSSLWRATMSAFLRTFAGLIGVVMGLLVSFIVLGILFSKQESTQEIQSAPLSLRPLIQPDQFGEVAHDNSELPLILQITVKGVIGTPGLDRRWIDQILMQMKRPPFQDRKWSGIFLVLQTPGGTADDSAAIYQRIMSLKEELKIPVIALVQGLCASGGMYIASSADAILSEPESIVGSVGVLLGPTFNLVGGMEKLGIQAYTLTEGLDKDVGNPFRTWHPNEFEPLRNIARATYNDFLNAVADGRPNLTADQIRSELGARIFTAQQGVCNGLIDSATSNRRQALSLLYEKALVSEAQIIEFQAPLQILEELLGMGAETLYRVTHPWKPSWTYGLKSPILLIAPSLAGD